MQIDADLFHLLLNMHGIATMGLNHYEAPAVTLLVVKKLYCKFLAACNCQSSPPAPCYLS